MRKTLCGAVVATLALLAQTVSAQQRCDALVDLKLPQATVDAAVSIPSGPLSMQDAWGNRISPVVPARCVVQGVARPTGDSEIKFQVWLPEAGWNGKYLQTGNGGWAGTIRPGALSDGVQRGYATAATDDGHEATAGGGQEWLIGHPEKLIDFAERAVHLTSLHARAILRAFYGRDAMYSYFAGCSEGGREAFVEAQRFADDFDGLLAGAPAVDESHLSTGFVWNEQALLNNSASAVPPAKLAALENAALAACDALDGVKDGRIEDPRRCRFDPGVIMCRGADSAACLTRQQVATVRKIYAGPKNPRTGQQIFPGYSPGAEVKWAAWIASTPPTTAAQFAPANAYYGSAVFENPNWDYRTLDFDRDVAFGDQKTGSILNATNPDLRSFRARRGKLIQYHGWGDPAIPALSSINYYEAVRSFLSRFPDARSSSEPVENFYRLFLVPGMGHCTANPGDYSFGNDVFHPVSRDPDHDVLSALERWVENGIEPERIIATGSAAGDPAKKVTHPLCPYPQVAVFRGSGDSADAANFVCSDSHNTTH